MQNVLFYILERETFIAMLGLRYFTLLCNDAEYKNMEKMRVLVSCTMYRIE